MEILPVIRDIALVVLAVETILLGIIGLVFVVTLWKLVGVARKHIDRVMVLVTEVLGTTADAARNLRGTTAFVSDHTARPLIELVSVIAAANQFARAAFSVERDNGKDGGK